MIETRGRGVLDRPVKPGDDGGKSWRFITLSLPALA